MTQDEVIRLVLQITGQKDIKAAGEELTKLKERLESVRNETEKTGKSFGQAGVQVGRFVQDATAGFGMGGLNGAILATSNNVEGLLMGLGIGGGLAGALTILMSIAPFAMNALKGIFNDEPVQKYTDRVDELKARIEELEKKPIKLTADTAEIERARKEVESLTKAKLALDALMGAQTMAEKESGQAVAEAIINTPGGQAALAAAQSAAGGRAVAGSAGVIGARTARDAAMKDVEFFTARASAATEPGAMFAAQEALKKANEKLAKANEDLAAITERIRTDAEQKFADTVSTAQGGKGLAQVQAQQQLGQILSDVGGAGVTVANRIGLAAPGFSGVRAGGGAAIGAMNQQMAETAKANREAADLTAQGLANEEAFRRKEEKRSEEEARDNRKAREEGKRATEDAARQFGMENPTAGAEAQAAILQAGNDPNAVLAVSQQLQRQFGLSPDVANIFATSQSNELQTKLQQAFSVTGSAAQAQNEVSAALIQMVDDLMRRYAPIQDAIRNNMQSLQRLGRQ
jgi:hypothetical protein